MKKCESFANEDNIVENSDEMPSPIPIKFSNSFSISNSNNIIIKFYNFLFLAFANQASIIYQYLLQQDNPYDFVNEYCTKVNKKKKKI